MLHTQRDCTVPQSRISKGSGVFWGLLAGASLTVANILLFYRHYTGEMTFPWDFLGGYHAQAFGWYADGSFFDPPKWFPWGDLGFPSYWSLQSGAFYLPLAVLDLFDQAYTIQTATVLQVLHVLAGSIGMYILLRTLRFEPLLAIAGALAFQFSSTFYSNAQHVDIIRATAFLPWLMWSLHPETLLRSWARPVVAAVILFQFLVAAYPGLIISAAYTLALFVGAYFLRHLKQGNILLSLAALVLVGASATAMAMVKWLPPFMEGDWAATGVSGGMSLSPSLIPTLLLPYDKPFLPNDVTMRSLWLAGGLLSGAVFLTRIRYNAKVSLLLVVAALVSAGIGPVLIAGSLPLPGFNISRFMLSDWRPTLHVGLIILACAGWQDAKTSTLTFIGRRSVFAVAGMLILAWIAVGQGYTLWDLLRPTIAISAGLSLAFVLTTASTSVLARYPRLPHLVFVGLSFVTVAEAYNFHHLEQRSWRLRWSSATEKQLFGSLLSQKEITDRSPLTIGRRPERLVVGATHQEVVQSQFSEVYNRCFYLPDFCSLGYNNLRLSLPHAKYRQAITDPVKGPMLLAFVKQPQKLFVFPKGVRFDLSAISAHPNGDAIESLVPDVEGAVVGYGGGWARYRLSTPTDVRVVENEIWTSGWTIRLCQNGQCLPPKKPSHTPQYLRTWNVPPGNWDIELSFEVRSERYIWPLFYFGLFLMGFAALLQRFGVERNREVCLDAVRGVSTGARHDHTVVSGPAPAHRARC